MSIIYNALQKTQKNLINKREFTPRRSWLDIVLLVFILFLLALVTFAYFPKIKKLVTAAPHPPLVKQKALPVVPSRVMPVAMTPASEMEYHGTLILNGVFLSEREKVALINNQPMHVGDLVEGKKILSIDLNKVRLQDQSNILILKSVS